MSFLIIVSELVLSCSDLSLLFGFCGFIYRRGRSILNSDKSHAPNSFKMNCRRGRLCCDKSHAPVLKAGMNSIVSTFSISLQYQSSTSRQQQFIGRDD
jgi:hypothetical protein